MAAPGLRVWVTRAEPGAGATAERLQARGHHPLVANLLAVRELDPAEPPVDAPALAFTSANGVRAFARLTARRDQDVTAVGDATARAARHAGFARVRSAGGDVDALAALIAAAPPQGGVLHPRGRETAGDLAGALARQGVEVRPLVVYETVAVDSLPTPAAEALSAGGLKAILLHSPKAARVLADLIEGLPLRLERVRAVGLSSACLAPLRDGGFGALAVAAEPTEAALLELLG